MTPRLGFAFVLSGALGLFGCGATDAGEPARDAGAGTDAGAEVGASDASSDDASLDAVGEAAVDASPPSDATDATLDVGLDAADVCGALVASIDALLPGLNACTAASDCRTFEAPICDSMGCFQRPVAIGADLGELERLAGEATRAGCDGFHCGCVLAPPALCLGGHCRACPPDCDGSCADLTDGFVAVAHAANWCGVDDDCDVLSTGLCPVGDLPCGGVFLNRLADVGVVQAVAGAYGLACGPATCRCPAPGPAVCVQGKCVSN